MANSEAPLMKRHPSGDRLHILGRLGFAFALVLIGASSIRESIGVPLPQEIALCGLGTVFLVGGGAYMMKWLWAE